MKLLKSIYVQCQYCGRISQEEIDVGLEDIYVGNYRCQCCGCNVGLNCGHSRSDIYKYYNLNIDDRYYKYK